MPRINLNYPDYIVITLSKNELGQFLSQEELNQLGDEEMEEIASRLRDVILENGYWHYLHAVILSLQGEGFFKDKKLKKMRRK